MPASLIVMRFALGFLLPVIAASIAYAPAVADAQAWTRNSGEGYLEVSYRTFESGELLDTQGERIAAQEFRQHAIAHYGELGLIDRWLMLVVHAELFQLNQLPRVGSTSGVGDARVALFSGLLEEPFRISIGAQLGLPFGDPVPHPGPDADSVAVATYRSLPLGDGEWDATFLLALGWSFPIFDAMNAYVQAVAGYALRTEGFADQLVYRGEFGVRPTARIADRFLLLFRVSGTELLRSVPPTNASTGADGVSFLTLGPELIGEIGSGVSLGLGVEFGLRGSNIRLGTLLKASLSFRFDPT